MPTATATPPRRRRSTHTPTPWRSRIIRLERIDPRDLLSNPANYRIHPAAQQSALAGAIQEIGFVDPITAQDGTNLLIDGHLRVAEAIKNGEPAIDVIYVDLTDAEADAALATIDPIGNLADHNREALAALLERIQSERPALAQFFADLADAEGIPDPAGSGQETGTEDDIPERPKLARSQPGDLWLLGDHRLLVGDATDPAAHARIMDGDLADILITDPPYGVAYNAMIYDAATKRRLHRRTDQKVVTNDDLGVDGTEAMVTAALTAVRLRAGAPFYIFTPDMYQIQFRTALENAGLQLRQALVWIKQQFVMGHFDYHWRHESILYGWVDGAPHWFLADRTIDTVIDDAPNPDTMNRAELLAYIKTLRQEVIDSAIREDRPYTSREHPTMKPTNLYTRLIRNSSRPADILLDPFAGSGTCYIAGELTGRPTYGIEIDPIYADVCVDRWQQYTGGSAVRA